MSTTREQRIAFTEHVREMLLRRTLLMELVRLGAAASALETGWGEHVPGSNLFGIKPAQGQTRVPDRPEIRAFPDEGRSVFSWLYLVFRSRLYEAPRERLIAHIVSLQKCGAEAAVYRAAWESWLRDFAAIYCPANPDYATKVLAIAHEQDAMLARSDR